MFSSLFPSRLWKKKSPMPSMMDKIHQNMAYEKLLQANEASQAQDKHAGANAKTVPTTRTGRGSGTEKLEIQAGACDNETAACEGVDGVEADDTVAMYHDAIKAKMPQTITIDTGTYRSSPAARSPMSRLHPDSLVCTLFLTSHVVLDPLLARHNILSASSIVTDSALTMEAAPSALRNNRNASVDMYHFPPGTTISSLLDAIAGHRPVGVIYDARLVQLPSSPSGPAASPAAATTIPAVRIRFKHAHSAARLFQLANQPGQGFVLQGGHKTAVAFSAAACQANAHEEGTRVVVFRGPRRIVAPDHLRRVWGAQFAHREGTQRVVEGPVDGAGVCEVTWAFTSFYWMAELAHSLFACEYGDRGDCTVWYGRDPCA